MEIDHKAKLLKQIGQNIAKARREKKMERKAIADELRITPQAVSNIENGKSDVGISRIFQIATLLDTPFEELLKVEGGHTYFFEAHSNTGGCQIQHFNQSTLNSAEPDCKVYLKGIQQQLADQLLLLHTFRADGNGEA